MKQTLWSKSGKEVQVGVLDPSNSQVLAASGTTTAYAADTTVLVTPTAGGCWIAIGTAPTATADTSGSHYIELAQDFTVESGDKINSTGAICVTPYK
jgi:hypothetical protein